MTKKNKLILLIVAVGIVFTTVISGTIAWIIAATNEVENTFTIGNVDITLTETTGKLYNLTPGVTLSKDPNVTVKAGSDDCWLFVKAEESAELESYASYHTEDGWTRLEGEENVYYRKVAKSDLDQSFNILRYNHVKVKDEVTEEQLAALMANLKLSFTAYAIQQTGFDTAELAWAAFGE